MSRRRSSSNTSPTCNCLGCYETNVITSDEDFQMRNKYFVDTNHGLGRTAMSNVGISLIDLPWMQVRPVLSFEAH